MLHFRALSQSEGILDIDAEVADRALNLRVGVSLRRPILPPNSVECGAQSRSRCRK